MGFCGQASGMTGYGIQTGYGIKKSLEVLKKKKNLVIKNVLYRGKNRRRIVLAKHWSAIKFVCQK